MTRERLGDESITVLHVDDDPEFADAASAFLERENGRFRIRTAISASEGLDRLADGQFDCIISDYDMPGQNGIEFLEGVREEYSDLPFILYTGKGSEEVASEAVSAGVTDYLQKGSGTDQYTVLANRVTNAVDRYRSQRTLERRTRTFRQYERMVNSMHEAACIYDTEGRFELVNEYLADWYGTTRTDLEGTESTLIHRIRQQTDGDPYQELLDGERDELYGEFADEFPNHGPAVLEYRLTPLIIDGTVEAAVGVARDVTERNERERKLELVETLFAHAQECQFIVDVADGAFELRHANGYYKRTVGLPPEEPATGQTPTDLFGDVGGREILDRYRECVETCDSLTYMVEVPVPVAGTVYRTILTPVVATDEVTHIVGTARDITDHIRRKEELQRQNDRLEEFASVASHDLRNPLQVADARLELIREECASDHIDDVAQALDRMDTLIEDLLTLARQGMPVGETISIDLAELVESCWRTVETNDASVDIRTDRTIDGHRGRLAQLFENLIRNAVEHGDGDVTVTVGALDDGFYVEDDGPGIPKAERSDVFETGYSTIEGGTGFGLSIVDQVVNAHGWEVRVTDGTDGGTRFEITDVDVSE